MNKKLNEKQSVLKPKIWRLTISDDNGNELVYRFDTLDTAQMFIIKNEIFKEGELSYILERN